jgi:Raf kinase inhibitor-like YbhB/YbcL family protein
MAMRLSIHAIAEGGEIPKRHTCDGKNVSIAIAWSGAPPDAKSFALIMDDPDAPAGTWNHWLLWDIPAETTRIAEGFQSGAMGQSGTNDFGNEGYGGPCPPRGHGPHRYYFRLFALSVQKLELKRSARRAALDSALRPHIIAEAQYMGRYERK